MPHRPCPQGLFPLPPSRFPIVRAATSTAPAASRTAWEARLAHEHSSGWRDCDLRSRSTARLRYATSSRSASTLDFNSLSQWNHWKRARPFQPSPLCQSGDLKCGLRVNPRCSTGKTLPLRSLRSRAPAWASPPESARRGADLDRPHRPPLPHPHRAGKRRSRHNPRLRSITHFGSISSAARRNHLPQPGRRTLDHPARIQYATCSSSASSRRPALPLPTSPRSGWSPARPPFFNAGTLARHRPRPLPPR